MEDYCAAFEVSKRNFNLIRSEQTGNSDFVHQITNTIQVKSAKKDDRVLASPQFYLASNDYDENNQPDEFEPEETSVAMNSSVFNTLKQNERCSKTPVRFERDFVAPTLKWSSELNN